MVDPSVKNYFDPLSKDFIIGGKARVKTGATLIVEDGGLVEGITGVAGAATASTLGGIKAANKGAGDTVEVKIDPATSKLYTPPYTLPGAGAEAIGGVKAAAAQADSAAADVPGLVADFNALLAKLRASGAIAAS